MKLVLGLIVMLSIVQRTTSCCPNRCNGRGICLSNGNGCLCDCFSGFSGGDCSLRTCALARAWSDEATGIDSAHALVECANRGKCDQNTGRCTCDAGFTGNACQRKACPLSCSGHGECRSMKYHATRKDLGTGAAVVYSSNWDAEMIFGCVCHGGYFGPDCTLRSCPSGDDPLTTSQLDEKQTVTCTATAGTFTLSFRGATTVPIAFDADGSTLATILTDLETINVASVTFSSGSSACTGSNVITIDFTRDFGSLPLLVGDSTQLTGSGLVIAQSQDGTKEDDACSNRGTCDRSTGVCTCFTGYTTSNGVGASGDRGDCGQATSITGCPGETVCSGHGVCAGTPTFKCNCYDGWVAGDCSKRSCPSGPAWFDEPSADNTAHALTECSGMGICDETTGKCTCSSGYEGGACERMSCPGSGDTACNGHGQCLTMSRLALEARLNGVPQSYTYGATPNLPATWDHAQVQGCRCDSGYTGHDCSLRTCPTGDNPRTIDQVKEVQEVVCTYTSASTFSLSFRGETTALIASSATAAQVKAALELLSTIGTVAVTYSSGTEACIAGGANTISVSFTTQLGNLPVLVAAVTDSAALSVAITTPTEGTVEDVTCSDNGTCDHTTGRCTCYGGMASSGSSNIRGNRDDCGYIMEIQVMA